MEDNLINNLKSEKDFQIALGRMLVDYGYEVYTDKKICELPTFTGDKEKPDLLVFYKENKREHKLITLSNPFAIECKKPEKLNAITKAILQVKKYNNKKYKTGKWSGELKSIILTSKKCFKNGHLYDWSIGSEEFNNGVNWCINHFLFSLSNSSGTLISSKDKLLIQFHNCYFKLSIGGIVNYEKWNNNYFTYGEKEDDTNTP